MQHPEGLIKRNAYLSFSDTNEAEVIGIMNKIDELKKLHSRVKYTKKLKISNIKISDVILFFVNNEYLNSARFKEEFKLTKILGKNHLFIIIGEVRENKFFDFNNLGVINLNVSREESLKRFQKFFLRFLLIEKIYFNQNIESYDLRLAYTRNFKKYITEISSAENQQLCDGSKNDTCLNRLQFIRKYSSDTEYLLSSYEFISSDEIILVYCKEDQLNYSESSKLLKIINILNGNVIGNIKVAENFFHAWIKHLEQVFIVYTNFYHETPWASLYSKSGKLLRKFEFDFTWKDLIFSVAYDHKGHNLYLNCHFLRSHYGLKILRFNENFKLDAVFKFKGYSSINIYNGSCYNYCLERNELNIYDLLFNIQTAIYLPSPIVKLTADHKDPITIFIQTTESVILLNPFNFSIFAYIENPFQLLSVHNDNILFYDSFENLFFYKINNFKNKQNNEDSKFMCSFSSQKCHFYKNPYKLPCGEYTCLDCICRSCNIQTNSVTCNSKSCQNSHKLPQKLLIRDFDFNKFIRERCDELMNKIILKGNQILKNTGNLQQNLNYYI